MDRHDRQQKGVELIEIPLFRLQIIIDRGVNRTLNNIRNHLIDSIPHTLPVKNTAALLIDNLALFIHDLIVFQQILTNAKVVALNLLLGIFNGACEHLVLNLLPLWNPQRIEHIDQSFRAKQTHEIILKGNVKPGHTGVSLTTCAPSKLVVNTSRLMALCTDNHQTASSS